ncbi:MAG TPA: hypothetical protein VEU33_15515 [Archangium sp.]|nr:hypothetical protein [Archangium sp.]
MSRLSACLLLLTCLTGCFRLSDPFYHFKDITPEEPHGPEYSLVFGSVEVEGGFFSPDSVDSIYFRRMQPGGEPDYWYVGEMHLFRVFQNRAMRSGHFVIALPPGAYELDQLADSGIFYPTRFHLSEEAMPSSRFFVTRPGLYDLGTLRISSPRGLLGPYVISRVEGDDPQVRAALIQQVVKGTPWERFLLEPGPGEQKPAKDRAPNWAGLVP